MLLIEVFFFFVTKLESKGTFTRSNFLPHFSGLEMTEKFFATKIWQKDMTGETQWYVSMQTKENSSVTIT